MDEEFYAETRSGKYRKAYAIQSVAYNNSLYSPNRYESEDKL